MAVVMPSSREPCQGRSRHTQAILAPKLTISLRCDTIQQTLLSSYFLSLSLYPLALYLVCAEWLHLQISRVRRHRQDAQRVSVAKSTFPALHSNDGGVGLDDVQLQCILQSKPDTVVDLPKSSDRSRHQGGQMEATHILLPLALRDTSRFGVPERVASTVQVNLARSLLASGHCEHVGQRRRRGNPCRKETHRR